VSSNASTVFGFGRGAFDTDPMVRVPKARFVSNV
jgi:hypothetical protein